MKQVETVTPAPGASPPARDAPTNSVGAGERLRLAIAGWRGPPPPSPPDRVSFDEELRQFDDDFKEAPPHLFEAHLADTPVATRPPVDVVDVSPVGEEEDRDVPAQLE